MANEIRIVPATPEHAAQLAAVMRPADVAELRSQGFEPLPALNDALRRSLLSFSAFYGDELGAMFGVEAVEVGGVLTGKTIHAIWSLTGPAFAKFPVAFVRAARRVVRELLKHWPVLCNLVDAQYVGALQLLRLLRAEFSCPGEYSIDGRQFIPFLIRRSSWADS